MSSLPTWPRGRLLLSVSWLGDGRVFYNLATYSGDSIERLVRKLRQLPAGTRVEWSLGTDLADRYRFDVDAVQAAARAAGVVLEIK